MPIPNHISSRISELDLQVAKSVPPGGNWKNVPTDIPLARLDTIRRGFAEGKGSRSTYYGRLHPDRPAYTINTWFTRPGNGCHLHYDFSQHRTLSLREAARLQSFPDSFVFQGPRTSIAKQIGNAVPPLLAYQLASSLPVREGLFIDLFSGAGGLGLGFTWAGWTPMVASDIDARFLETHAANIDCPAIHGDLRDPAVADSIVDAARRMRAADPGRSLWVLGGPPCQGFSTAGKRRSMADDRNHLFRDYAALVKRIAPDGFIFENVMGLLNMEKGAVFKMVRESLAECMPFVDHFVLKSEEYGVPQRRTRVIIVGHGTLKTPKPPPRITSMADEADLFGQFAPAVSVGEALSDLPPLGNGEDGEHLSYLGDPATPFQRLMRGDLQPCEYIEGLRDTSR